MAFTKLHSENKATPNIDHKWKPFGRKDLGSNKQSCHAPNQLA